MVKIDDELIPILNEMYMDLSMNKLEVCLVPGDHPDQDRQIRAVCNSNPYWYKKFCKDHPCTRCKKRSDRKDHTRIKRNYTLIALERMIRNKQSSSQYAEYLIDIAKDMLETYKEYEELMKESKEEFRFKPWDNQF